MVGVIWWTLFFSRKRDALTTTFVFIYFYFCFLYFVFDICILWLLHFNKTWLSECFSLLGTHVLLLSEYFLFYFNDFIFFIWLPILILINWLLSLLLLLLLFLSYCHYYFFTFNFFNFYCSSFNHSILYLCINQKF